jgi:hypothetical protein
MFLMVDVDMISKHTFLSIVILISKHCIIYISKHEGWCRGELVIMVDNHVAM